MANTIQKKSTEEINKNKTITLQSFLSASFSNAQQFLKFGTENIKDELSFQLSRVENRLQKMTLPINNFLKDMTQLDNEIEYESKKQAGLICEGNFIPLEQALLSPMEENY